MPRKKIMVTVILRKNAHSNTQHCARNFKTFSNSTHISIHLELVGVALHWYLSACMCDLWSPDQKLLKDGSDMFNLMCPLYRYMV